MEVATDTNCYTFSIYILPISVLVSYKPATYSSQRDAVQRIILWSSSVKGELLEIFLPLGIFQKFHWAESSLISIEIRVNA